MNDLFKDFNYYEKLVKKSIKTKTLMHTENFSQDRSLGKVGTWSNIDEI